MHPQWQWTQTKLFTLSRVLNWGLTEYLRDFFETQVDDWATEDREAMAVETMMVWIRCYRNGAFTETTLRELLDLSLRQYTYSHRLRDLKLKPHVVEQHPFPTFVLPLLTSLIHLAPPHVGERLSESRFDRQGLEKINRDLWSMVRLSQDELLELGGYISSLAFQDWRDPPPVVELRSEDF